MFSGNTHSKIDSGNTFLKKLRRCNKRLRKCGKAQKKHHVNRLIGSMIISCLEELYLHTISQHFSSQHTIARNVEISRFTSHHIIKRFKESRKIFARKGQGGKQILNAVTFKPSGGTALKIYMIV